MTSLLRLRFPCPSASCCGSFIDVEELATRIEGVLTTEVTTSTEVVLTLVDGHY
jgi:hypothetical protein